MPHDAHRPRPGATRDSNATAGRCGTAHSGCGPALQRVLPAESRLRPGMAAPQVHCQFLAGTAP
jgi:hypothetical protein